MDNNSKILPICIPPCKTYQSMAFTMAIVLSHDNISNYFYNAYSNVRCTNSLKMWDLLFQIYNTLWDPLREDGILVTDFYHTKEFSSQDLKVFLNRKIDEGNYILFYSTDEYYLSYTPYYKKRHLIHDTYVYGYEDDYFWVMAYKDEKLQMFKVPQTEIVDAIISCANYIDEEIATFCACRPTNNEIAVDFERMKKNIRVYFEGSTDDEYVYGLPTYKIIANSMSQIIKNDVHESIDIRIFRMLWEHKHVMFCHMQKLNEIQDIPEALKESAELELMAKKAFRLAIKYQLSRTNETLIKLADLTSQIETREEYYLSRLIASWQ